MKIKKIFTWVESVNGGNKKELQQSYSNFKKEYKRLKAAGIKNHITDLFDYKGKIYEKK